ncbi:MAG: hypothetical protein ABI592_14390 [Acidobacteriota bacterium]
MTIRSGSATVKIFGNGVPPEGCYGSYGDVPHGVPNGNFTLPGTFTQLTGVYPGRIDYPAQFTGSVEGSRMTISIQVPGESRLLGPYLLTAGVTNAWGPCLYP